MKALKTTFKLLAASSALLAAERIADPFQRHDHNYSLEGPAHHSEVFYISSNWHDAEGNKHDDRRGDGLMALSVVSGVGVIALRFREDAAQQTATVPAAQ